MSAAPASAVAPAGGVAPRPLLAAVDRSDATLMSVGTVASGVLAYLFNVLAARSLGPEGYGAIGALWGGMFLLAVLLFRPLEQTVSRAVSHHLARGEDARPAVRSVGRLTAAVTLATVAACVAAWTPLTDRVFGGEPVLTVALIAGLVGYAISYFTRGLTGGVRWFGGYGLLLLADGGIRLVLALPLLFIASQTVAAVAIAAAAAGGALAPLLSRDRRRLRALEAPGRGEFDLPEAATFALPAAVIGGCEQILVSGGPLLVLIAGGEGATAAAGVLFAATLLVRAPVFLLQGIQASLLPNLSAFRAQGDDAALHRATVRVALILCGIAALLAAGCLLVGPYAMEVLYGADFVVGRIDLALLSVGIGGFMAAGVFSQAALARVRPWAAARAWSAGALVFVTLELGLPGSPFHRVSIAFAAASLLAALLLMRTLWRWK